MSSEKEFEYSFGLDLHSIRQAIFEATGFIPHKITKTPSGNITVRIRSTEELSDAAKNRMETNMKKLLPHIKLKHSRKVEKPKVIKG